MIHVLFIDGTEHYLLIDNVLHELRIDPVIHLAAPLASVGAITASGQKVSKSAGPLASVGAITAAGGGSLEAPLAAVGTITAYGGRLADDVISITISSTQIGITMSSL